MYDVKDLIEKMKLVAKLKTNTDLAKELNVSYNTLNTWLKRKKLPQEVIINFANKYNTSLDYLLLKSNPSDNVQINLFNNEAEIPIDSGTLLQSFVFYGEYEPLNIKPGDILELNSTLLHSDAHYLLHYNDIYFIAKVIINIFSDSATIITTDNYKKEININNFKDHNMGMIIGKN